MEQRRVYLHVGLPKTGTTYLQQALWESRLALAGSGVAFPGDDRGVQRRAAYDLIGRRLQGEKQPDIAGSWRALTDMSRRGGESTAIISEELLVHARPRHVRRIISDLSPAEVHVVVTVRDVRRAMASMWQHQVSKGATWPWSEYLAAVRSPDQGPPTAGVGFWLRYDLRRVLEMWGTAVPPRRIHVIVVPPAGTDPSQLLALFAEATELDVALTPPHQRANKAVGVVGTEVLRQLNLLLAGRLSERQYFHVMNRSLKPALRALGHDDPLAVPVDFHAWLTELSKEMARFLEQSEYDIVGDPEDLVVTDLDAGGSDPAAADSEQVAEAALAALAGTVVSHAELWSRARRRQRVEKASTRTRLASGARALASRARKAALEQADRHPLFARAAQQYLRMTASTPARRTPIDGDRLP
jgi:hypothetical protein